jgi:hypothetical protein
MVNETVISGLRDNTNIFEMVAMDNGEMENTQTQLPHNQRHGL